MRGGLWDPEAKVDRTVLPTGTEVFTDQLGSPNSTVQEEVVMEGSRKRLWRADKSPRRLGE